MTWQVGDLALCLGAGDAWEIVTDHTYHGPHPAGGEINRVSELHVADGQVCLCFDDYPENGYFANHFRKIKPDTEPCEEEFTVLIKRGRKVSQ